MLVDVFSIAIGLFHVLSHFDLTIYIVFVGCCMILNYPIGVCFNLFVTLFHLLGGFFWYCSSLIFSQKESCYTLNPKLLVQGEVIGSCQGICRTAAQVALVEDGEATVLRTQIHYLLGSLALPG